MKNSIIIVFLLITCSVMATDREKQIRLFIEDELNHYPEAQLTDLYKNYFQDAYGPGHLIPDTTRAGAYLDYELKQPEWDDKTQYQALGVNHDFYRVNLIFYKNGNIPRDTLLLAMAKSAKLARNPDIESWKAEWNEVLRVIKKMKPNLPNLESDEKLISETLSKGEVVMHHSKHYEELYHPHYRIIHKSIFNNWLGKYIQ
jgi:hypothetical protein